MPNRAWTCWVKKDLVALKPKSAIMEFAFRITGKLTLFARKIKHRRPINKEETSQFPYSLFMNIFLNSYLVDFVMNPIARFAVRIFTFFLQSTPLHGPHRIKFAPIGILLNPLKHPSVRPLLVLTLLCLCSSFGSLPGQESTPWWKSLFRGTQQTRVARSSAGSNARIEIDFTLRKYHSCPAGVCSRAKQSKQ